MACLPAAAHAATSVTYSTSGGDNRLTIGTDSDDANDIGISQSGNAYTITENGFTQNGDGSEITLSETVNGLHQARCHHGPLHDLRGQDRSTCACSGVRT